MLLLYLGENDSAYSSVRQIHLTGTVRPAGQICDRSDLPHFQPYY